MAPHPLSELLNLPDCDGKSPSESEVSQLIEQNQALIMETDNVIERINDALPSVRDLDATDQELDELANMAKDKFNDLVDLGMNVEARHSGPILQTAAVLLGHAISAKTAKIDRKLRTVNMQLQKAKLDASLQKSDGQKILDAEEGGGVVMDRNELIRTLLGKPKS